jgi:hypothetical protein
LFDLQSKVASGDHNQGAEAFSDAAW